jgi:hypothetical protein
METCQTTIEMTATPIYALPRTATAVTARASAAAFPPAMHEPRQPPPSLSLGSLLAHSHEDTRIVTSLLDDRLQSQASRGVIPRD